MQEIHNSFKVTLIKEGVYPRLYITHPKFAGRIKKRIGKDVSSDDKYFLFKLSEKLEISFRGKEVSKDNVQAFIDRYVSFEVKLNRSFLELYDDFLSYKRQKINKLTKKPIKSGTLTPYLLAKKYFEKFLNEKKVQLTPDAITNDLLDNFYVWLPLSDNTRVKLHGKIKAFLTYLVEIKGIQINNSFKESKFMQEYDNQEPKENDISLNVEQIQKLIELRENLRINPQTFKPENYKPNIIKIQEKQHELKRVNLIKCLDCFLFMCGTGQYHSDVKQSKLNIDRVDSNLYIRYRRAKNNSLCDGIPVINDGILITQEIIDQYKIKHGGNFPLNLSLSHFDKHLKSIGKMAGFDFELKNKMARKTFATLLYFNYKVPVSLIQIMLGHKNTRQTAHYIRIHKNELVNAIYGYMKMAR